MPARSPWPGIAERGVSADQVLLEPGTVRVDEGDVGPLNPQTCRPRSVEPLLPGERQTVTREAIAEDLDDGNLIRAKGS